MREGVAAPRERPSRDRIHGQLLHADGTTPGVVDFWIWGDRRPPWAELPDEPRLLQRLPSFAARDGFTAVDGRFTLPRSTKAVTFALFPHHAFTFEPGDDPAPTFLLPELTKVGLRMTQARADDAWQVELNPFVRGRGLVRTVGAGERRHGQAMFEYRFSALGNDVCEFPVVADWLHHLHPIAKGFEIRPFFNRLKGPKVVDVHPETRRVRFFVRIEEPDGSRANVAGLYSLRAKHGGARSGRIENGNAHAYTVTKPHEARLSVLLEDGERFERDVEVGTARSYAFVRGTGRPSLRVELPADLAKIRTILYERRDGSLGFGLGLDRDADALSSLPFFTRTQNELRISNLPRRWKELFIVDANGRFAHTFPTPRTGSLRAARMPDDPLRIDLAAEHRRRSQPKAGTFELCYTLTSSTGVRRRFGLFKERFDGSTGSWPVWQKQVPRGVQSTIVLRRDRPRGLRDTPVEGAPAKRAK